ncbi:MAG: M14 metallopeptidase family protein, partial [Bryobacteraceae bacterium]
MLLRLVLCCLAAWVAQAAVPTPESHFGHRIGADRTVLDWSRVVSYFQALEKSSPRIKVEELGKTAMGRPFLAATIAAPETLKSLGKYLDIQRKLADPRLTAPSEVEHLVAQGKTVVLITCSIHSTELASTHTAVEFAYRLLTEEKPRFKAILENTIFILVPSLNPDGVDIVTEWYRKTIDTPFEGTSPPELYHKYVGHDNNRDWYIFSQPETRLTISKLHNVWRPQIVYDVHQQGAYSSRMMAPPWLDPVEPNVDAILVQEMNMIGTGIAADLTAAGKPGVSVNSSYDFWSPARHYQAFHGGLRILTESASARLASPITVRRDELDRNGLGYNAQERSWNHIEPWQGGTWRLRDIIDYQLIAMESCLYQAALRREDLLRNFHKVFQRQLAMKKPYAFMIPARQSDLGATRKLIDTLVFGMVEVEVEKDGSHRVRMAQPYGAFAKALLEKQNYPDMRMYPGGPPRKPYDVTAHTLPLLMGVDVWTMEKAFDPVPVVAPIMERPGRLSASDTESWRAINRIWTAKGAVWRDPQSGDFSPSKQSAASQLVRRPRIALYKSFNPVMDEGWTRWLLEDFGFAYQNVRNADLQAGSLKQRYDVIVFPDQTAPLMLNGYRKGSMPAEYTGGIGVKGVAELKEFAGAGGTLVFLNKSTEFAIEYLGVKATNVTREVSSREYYSPGSLLNVQLDPKHPLCYGMPANLAIWSEQSPAWENSEAAVAKY